MIGSCAPVLISNSLWTCRTWLSCSPPQCTMTLAYRFRHSCFVSPTGRGPVSPDPRVSRIANHATCVRVCRYARYRFAHNLIGLTGAHVTLNWDRGCCGERSRRVRPLLIFCETSDQAYNLAGADLSTEPLCGRCIARTGECTRWRSCDHLACFSMDDMFALVSRSCPNDPFCVGRQLCDAIKSTLGLLLLQIHPCADSCKNCAALLCECCRDQQRCRHVAGVRMQRMC